MHYKMKIKVQITFKEVSVSDFRRVIFIFEMVPIKQKSNSLGIKKKKTEWLQNCYNGNTDRQPWNMRLVHGKRLPREAP